MSSRGEAPEGPLLHELSTRYRHNHSAASSTGSNHGTISPDSTFNTDFDPIRDDAANSTGIFPQGYDPRLPENHRDMLHAIQGKPTLELRNTTKKYGRWAPRAANEYVVNTSAIGKLFTDFSSGPQESVSSVETGRATGPRSANGSVNITNTSRNALSSNRPISSNIMSQVRGRKTFATPRDHTPQSRPSSVLQNALCDKVPRVESTEHVPLGAVEEKENIPPSARKAAQSSHQSNGSLSASGKRRPYSNLQAHIIEGSQDHPLSADEHSNNLTFKLKNTRFPKSGKSSQLHSPQVTQSEVCSRKSAIRPLEASTEKLRSIPRYTAKSAARSPNDQLIGTITPSVKIAVVTPPRSQLSATANTTQRSFIIQPPHAESSELIASSIKGYGVPVQIRGGRVQQRQSSGRALPKHSGVDDIDPDLEEEDLYELIDELRENVADLELANATAQSTILRLESEKQQLVTDTRPDSAIGESDGDSSKKQQQFFDVELKRLTSESASLQNLLEHNQRTVSAQETQLITQGAELEQAVRQASQCNGLINTLSRENDATARMNMELKLENDSLVAKYRVMKVRSETLSAEFKTISERNSALEEEIRQLQAQVTKLSAQHDNMNQTRISKSPDLEEHCHQLISDKKQAELQYQASESKLKDQIQQLKSQRDETAQMWKATETSLRKKIDRSNEANKILQEHSDKVLKISGNLESRLSRVRKSPRSCSHQAQSVDRNSGHQRHIPLNNIGHASEVDKEINSAPAGKENDQRGSFKTAQLQQRIDVPTNSQSLNTAVAVNGPPFNDAAIDITTASTDFAFEQSYTGSNYSDELGHGYMDQMLAAESKLRSLLKARDEAGDKEGQNNTLETLQPDHSSCAASPRTTSRQGISGDAEQPNRSVCSIRARSPEHFASLQGDSKHEDHEDVGVTSATGSHKPQVFEAPTRSSRHRHSLLDDNVSTTPILTHAHHYSATSINISGNRRQNTDDMTSKWLAEDLCAAAEHNKIKERPVLSANARHVLDSLCKHQRQNCTICARLATRNKYIIMVPKPVPVSERVQYDHEDDQTLRPCVSPSVALATVIKGLEDEVAHLKIKHASVHEQYMNHDVSMGKRRRTSLTESLDEIMAVIERKSEQIYGLYDVLEGQKQSGQEMSQVEVDITLSKFGIDDDELPWNGCSDEEE